MNENNYRVYDLMDGWADKLGEVKTLAGVKKLARIQYEDTDGDCSIYFIKRDKETGKFNKEDIQFLAGF